MNRISKGAGVFALALSLLASSAFAEVEDVQSYGFIGDGASHPLSSVMSFHGEDTTGWTLDQWKAVLPSAQALSDEIDGLAIQTFINSQPRPRNGVEVVLPPCVALLSRPIVSGAGPIKIRGAGQYLTKLVQVNAGLDAWHHATPDTVFYPPTFEHGGYYAGFSAEGVAFQCRGLGGVALRVNLNPASGFLRLSDVWISGAGDQGANHWRQALIATGCSNTFLSTVNITGENSATNQADLTGAANALVFTQDTESFPGAGQYIFFIRDTNVMGYNYALEFDTLQYHGTEGAFISDCNFNQCMGALYQKNTFYPEYSYRAPQYFLHNCQSETYGTIMEFEGASIIKVTNCLFFTDKPTAPGNTPPADYDLFHFRNCFDIKFSGNTITNYAGAVPRYIFNFESNVHEASVSGRNQISAKAGAKAALNVGADCTDVSETDNDYYVWPADTDFAVGALKTEGNNFSEAQTSRAAGKLGYFAQVSPTGVTQLTGSSAGTTDENGDLEVVFPGGIFALTPIVLVSNGDSLNGPENAVSVVIATVTNRGFKAHLGGPTGVPRRVNWQATGQ